MRDWQRIEEIFGSVAELEPAERSGRLDHLCGSDSELRREVESLLASHEEASTAFLDRPVVEVGGRALPGALRLGAAASR